MGGKRPYDTPRPTEAQVAARRANAAKATEGRKKAVEARRAAAAANLDQARVPPFYVSQARREAARAELAELEVQERKGELVSAAESRAAVLEAFAAVRTRLLGLAARIKQRCPNVADEDAQVIDDLVREALEELAEKGTR